MEEYQQLGIELARGLSLTPANARLLQSEISTQPEDARKMVRLLGYYSSAKELTPEEFDFFLENLSWCISTMPSAEFLFVSHRGIHIDGPDHAYATIAETWIAAADCNPEDPRVALNAANFFSFYYPQISLRMLVRSVDQGAEVPGYLRFLCETCLRVLKRDRDRAQSVEDIVMWLCDSAILSVVRVELWLPLAELMFEFGELERAKQYLEFLLDPNEVKEKSQRLNDDRRSAHLLRGRIAIAEGDVRLAREELLRATDVRDTPHLKKLGPSMDLARELLRVGERQIVIDYIRRWRGRWKCIGDFLLTRWEDEIRRGIDTDFSTDFGP